MSEHINIPPYWPVKVSLRPDNTATEFYRPATRPRAGRGVFVLGICGSAGAGKNTVADHLVRTYGQLGGAKVPANDGPMDVRQYAFATELKIEVFDWLHALAFLESEGLCPDRG